MIHKTLTNLLLSCKIDRQDGELNPHKNISVRHLITMGLFGGVLNFTWWGLDLMNAESRIGYSKWSSVEEAFLWEKKLSHGNSFICSKNSLLIHTFTKFKWCIFGDSSYDLLRWNCLTMSKKLFSFNVMLVYFNTISYFNRTIRCARLNRNFLRNGRPPLV